MSQGPVKSIKYQDRYTSLRRTLPLRLRMLNVLLVWMSSPYSLMAVESDKKMIKITESKASIKNVGICFACYVFTELICRAYIGNQRD